MPFKGRHLALDLLVRRPDEVAERYLGGDPIIRYPGFETTAEDAAELIDLADSARLSLLQTQAVLRRIDRLLTQ